MQVTSRSNDTSGLWGLGYYIILLNYTIKYYVYYTLLFRSLCWPKGFHVEIALT